MHARIPTLSSEAIKFCAAHFTFLAEKAVRAAKYSELEGVRPAFYLTVSVDESPPFNIVRV
jgi:hypothetical protein